MKTGSPRLKAGFLFLLILISYTSIYSQATNIHVFQEWADNVGISNQVYKSGSAFDNAGNLYTIGGNISLNGDFDWQITKYRPSGQEAWSVSIDTNGYNDYLTDIVIDANCNIYLTGAFTVDTAQGMDVGIVKMDSSGVIQWVYTYDNGQSYPYYNDGGASITLDGNGYVNIAGYVTDASTLEDFLILQVKPSGVFQWLHKYDSNNLMDAAGHIYYNGTNVVITGKVQKTVPYHAIHSREYNASGSLVATSGAGSTLDSITQVHDIAVANNGDIYVVGYLQNPSTGRNAKIMKLDSTLNVAWQFNFTYPFDDEANSVRIDNQNRVYIAGYRTQSGSNKDFMFARLNTSGSVIWGPNYFDGVYSGNDIIYATAIDSIGNPIFTGFSQTDSLNTDYYTIKYDTAGSMIWQIGYNGIANKNDLASEIALDNLGAIYVIGQSQDTSGINSEFITVKYVEHELFNVPDDDTIPSNFDVTPNLGQLLNADTIINVNTTVKYYSTGPAVFFEDTKLMHLFSRIDTSATPNDTLVRVDMVLTSDTTRKVFAQDTWGWYSNFYYPHTAATKGIVNVPAYKKIVYSEIYPHIDMHVSANVRGIKEQFVLKPGADPKDIAFVYEGADSVYTDNNDLVIATILDTIRYKRPNASQIDSSGNYVSLGWDPYFIMSNDTVFFDSIQGFNSNLPLVIEMNQGTGVYSVAGGAPNYNLEWSTYYGGINEDQIIDVSSNTSDRILWTGNTNSPSVPIQNGSSNGTYHGYSDAFYILMNTSLGIIHRTYYGGNNADYPHGGTIGKDNYISIVGFTNSSDLNITSNGINFAYNPGDNGNEGFIAQFNQDGILLMDSYLGSDGTDACFSVAANNVGDYVVGGFSKNGNNFPLKTYVGGYNQSFTGNNYTPEGFIATWKCSVSDGIPSQFEWATYFGGKSYPLSGVEGINTVQIDDFRKIWAFGVTDADTNTVITSPCTTATSDHSFPIVKISGKFSQDTLHGYTDMFVAEFDASKRLVWSTYLGTQGQEGKGGAYNNFPIGKGSMQGKMFVKRGLGGDDIYLTGTTELTSSIYPVGIPYAVIDGSSYSQDTVSTYFGNHAFIIKFHDRQLKWYTPYSFDSPERVFGTGISVDNYDFIYVTGQGSSELTDISGICNGSVGPSLFPICNYSGSAYIESDINGYFSGPPPNYDPFERTFIAGFNPSGKLIWSSRFGNGRYNLNWDAHILNNKLYIGGYSEVWSNDPYTLWDPTGSTDWFVSSRAGSREIVMSRFALQDIQIGIEEEKNFVHLNVYPNPTNNMLYLEALTNDGQSFQIIDMMGNVAISGILNSNSVDVSGLSAGVYVISIKLDNNSYYKKFIKYD